MILRLGDNIRFRKPELFLFSLTAFIAIAVLLGWALEVDALKSVLPGMITMKPNTACGLLLASFASFLLVRFRGRPIPDFFILLLTIFIGLIGILTLSEYLFGINLGIDELFFVDYAARTRWPPGRLAPITALSFLFISVSIITSLGASKNIFPGWKRSTEIVNQSLLLVVWLTSFQAFVGYLCGVTYSFGSAYYTQIAIHTAVGFIFLSSALLVNSRDAGLMKSLSSQSFAGQTQRKLLFAAVLVPPLINVFQVFGVHHGWWDQDFGVLLRVTGNVIFFAWIAFHTGSKILKVEEARAALEIKQSESRRLLEVQEAQFSVLANSIPQLAWMARADGHIYWYNQHWFTYTGTDASKMDGWGWQSVHDPQFLGLVLERWTASIHSGLPFEMEFPLRKHDGTFRWFLTRVAPVRDANGTLTGWVGSNTDINEQKILIDALKDQREIRERFVNALSHDLRTPMTTVKMSGQLILKKLDQPASVLKLAERIIGNMSRADAMIRDLLDANRLNSGETIPLHLEKFRIGEEVKEILSEMDQIFDIKISYNNALEGNEAVLDKSSVRRMLENLIGNAVKYGTPGSLITVTLDGDSSWFELGVLNRGVPIPSHDLATLFLPYRRSSNSKNQIGWGIGLALVKGMAEAHSGSVSVVSSEVEGTKFVVRLPRGLMSHG